MRETNCSKCEALCYRDSSGLCVLCHVEEITSDAPVFVMRATPEGDVSTVRAEKVAHPVRGPVVAALADRQIEMSSHRQTGFRALSVEERENVRDILLSISLEGKLARLTDGGIEIWERKPQSSRR